MLNSILIEMTRGLMSYRTVIAPTEQTATAFPASNWFPYVLGWSCLQGSATPLC